MTDTRSTPARRAALSRRAVVLGMVLLVVEVCWVNWGNGSGGIFGAMGFQALPPVEMALLVVLVALNSGLARVRRSWMLSRGEMITLFVILTVGGAFAVCVSQLSSMVCHPIYYGATQPAAYPLFPLVAKWIPEFLAPHDLAVLKPLYLSGDFLQPAIWRAWVPAIVYWSVFFSLIGVVFICLNSLIYYRWSREERLDFPITRLPLMVAQSHTLGGLLRSRMLLLGAAVTMLLEGVNVLSHFNPLVPHLQLNYYSVPLGTSPPWVYLGYLRLACVPYVVGLSFLLPVEMLFSCWALYLIWKAEDFIWNAFGLSGASAGMTNFPWIREQANGAWLAVFFIVVWSGRKHLLAMAREAMRRQPTDVSARVALSPRIAFVGLIGGFIALCVASVAAGMQPWFAVAFFAIYLVFSLTLNRISCQVGPPVNDTFPTNVGYALAGMFGTNSASPASLTIMTTYYQLYRAPGNTPMSHTMFGLRYAESTGQSQGGMARAMLVAIILALPAALVSVLILDYRTGLETAGDPTWRIGAANEAQAILGSFVNTPSGPKWDQITAMAASAGFTVLLAWGQSAVTGFPLHPVGWAIATTWISLCYWSTFLGVWLIKVLVLRYGGLRLYRQVVPFFLGLVLGDCLIILLIALLSTVFGWRGISQL